MAIVPYSISANDITVLSRPDAPVSVEIRGSIKPDRPLAHGWLTTAEIEPGFHVFAARYDCHESYAIDQASPVGLVLNLNLGDTTGAVTPKQQYHIPNSSFTTLLFNEPEPVKLLRDRLKRQERCGVSLSPDWIQSGAFTRFDDTGLLARKLAQRRIVEVGAASPALLAAGFRLFEACNFAGPLAGLRREAAALAFFAEAITNSEDRGPSRPASRIELMRVERVRDMLNHLSPDMDLRLAELADHHGMSVRTLCRHFRLAFGTTVLGYVTERRMENARIALQSGGATIDQAAHIAGFAHTSNFSAAFRRRYGQPPGKIAGARSKAHRD